MTCTLTVDDPCTRTLRFSIDRALLEREIEEGLRELARRAQFKGFRPGKVPLDLVRRTHGPKLAEDARRRVMSQAFSEAVREHKLQPVGEPEFNLQALSDEAGSPFTFEFKVEVVPDFDLKDIEGIPVRVELPAVTDDLVAAEVERFREQGAELHDPPAGASISRGDVLRATVTYVVEGQDLPAREGRPVVLRHDLVDDLVVPGAALAFEGRHVLDTVELSATLASGFEPAEHAGKAALLRVLVTEHKVLVVPALDEALLQRVGLKTADELTAALRQRIEAQRVRLRDDQVDRALQARLLETHEVALPGNLLRKAVERRVHELAHRLADQQGLGHEEAHHRAEGERGKIEEATRDALKASFILARVAREQQLHASHEEAEAQVRLLARSQQADPERLLAAAHEEGWLSEVQANLTEQKVREWLRTRARVTETAPAAGPR